MVLATSKDAIQLEETGLWAGQGLNHGARHVVECHLSQENRIRNELNDVASTIHQSPAVGSTGTVTVVVTVLVRNVSVSAAGGAGSRVTSRVKM